MARESRLIVRDIFDRRQKQGHIVSQIDPQQDHDDADQRLRAVS